MQSIRLTDIERRSWRAMQQDGLMDILFGFLLLGACVSALVGLLNPQDWIRIATLSSIQFGGVLFMLWARRKYVTPRTGIAKFSMQRVQRARTLRIVLIVCVAVTILLVALTTLSTRLGFRLFGDANAWSAWGVISAVILIPIGALAYFRDYPRLLLHGSLFVIAEFFLIVMGLEDTTAYAPALLFGTGSAISFSIGIPIFARFLKRVPPAELETEGASHD